MPWWSSRAPRTPSSAGAPHRTGPGRRRSASRPLWRSLPRSSDGPRLPRPRRTDEQHSLGDAGSDLLELRRIAQELDHLMDVGLDGFVARNVVERGRRALRRVHVPRVAAERRGAGRAGRSPPGDPQPQSAQEEDRQEQTADRADPSPPGGRGRIAPSHVVLVEQVQVLVGDHERPLGGEGCSAREGAGDGTVAGQGDRAHPAGADVGAEGRVGLLGDRRGSGAPRARARRTRR